MRTATLGALAALSLLTVLALPPASADLVPQEALVDQLVTGAAQQAADAAHGAGDAADSLAGQAVDGADQQLGIAGDAARGAASGADGAVRDASGRAGNDAALVLGTAGDGLVLVQQLDARTTRHVLDALHAGAGLATRSTDRAGALTAGLAEPVPPVLLATYDAVPKPFTVIHVDVTVDVGALFDALAVESPLLLIANGPDVAALQQALLDYAAAAASAPGGVLAPASGYAVQVVHQGGDFATQTEGDTLGTGLVVVGVLAQ